MKQFILTGILATALLLPVNLFSKNSDLFKQEFLDRVNSVREKGCKCGATFMPPVQPLVWNDVLAKAAFTHAKDMAKKNYFSHTSLDGRTSEQRVITAGYDFKGFKSYAVGENIAMGQQSIAEVMDGWFKSEGHCRNLMTADFKEIGVAQYNDFWVQEFGGRVPLTAEQQRLLKSGKMKIIERQVQ